MIRTRSSSSVFASKMSQQRRNRVAENDRLQRPVPEIVSDAADPVRFALPGEVGDFRFFARSVDPKCRRSVQEAFAVQVNFHAFGRTGRQCRVEQHGFFADAAFETVPPVRFVRVCRIVSPQIEIGSQETFGRMLADELFQFRPRRPFVPRQLFLPFDPDVAFGQQVLPGRNVPRRAACCEQAAANDDDRQPQPPFCRLCKRIRPEYPTHSANYFTNLKRTRRTPSAQSLEISLTGGISAVFDTCAPMHGQLSKSPIWTMRTVVAPSGSRDRL